MISAHCGSGIYSIVWLFLQSFYRVFVVQPLSVLPACFGFNCVKSFQVHDYHAGLRTTVVGTTY